MTTGNSQKRVRNAWIDPEFCALSQPHPAGIDGCSCQVVEEFRTKAGGVQITNRTWARSLSKRPVYGLPVKVTPSSTHTPIDDHGTDTAPHLSVGGSRARRIGMGLGRILGIICRGLIRAERTPTKWECKKREWYLKKKPEERDF